MAARREEVVVIRLSSRERRLWLTAAADRDELTLSELVRQAVRSRIEARRRAQGDVAGEARR